MFVIFFMAGIYLRHVHYTTPVAVNFQHQMEFGNYNTRWGMIVATAVVGIKLAKNWYLQAQENLEMLKKKNRTEMQLQKACLRPALLFRSLDSIYKNIQDGSGLELATILRLSELLSYSLYENSKELVPLERELEQLRNFIAIEQAGNGVDVQIRTGIDTAGKYIAPLATIKSLEEAIASSHYGEQGARLMEVLVIEANSDRSVALVFRNESGATVELPLALNPKAVVYENE